MLRVVIPEERPLMMDLDPDHQETHWIDGKWREVMEWDLLDASKVLQDVRFWWDSESHFTYREQYFFSCMRWAHVRASARTISPPPISISRTVTSRHASDGAFTLSIENNSDDSRRSIYSEVWPWWVKGWMSEIEVRLVGKNGTHRMLPTSL